MTKFIRELLKKNQRNKSWLALQLDIPRSSIAWKLANDKWSFKDWLKIIEVFELSETEILELAKGEQK